MPTPARLWLVRHGQTDWNIQGRIQGHTPTDLNDHGRAQARHLAEYFRSRPYAAVYTSDLPRARSTAQIIAGALGLLAKPTAELRERKLGEYEGKTSEEIRILRARAAHGAPGSGDLADWTGVPGVESDDEVWARTLAILDEISQAHPGQNVLVVTHGGVLARVLFRTLGIPDRHKRHFSLANGIVAVVEFRGDDLFLLSYADLGLLLGGNETGDTSVAPE